ncbi:MAG: hypothetical protein ACXVFQ_18560 [Solirubrobacteraceae bacterium]
MTRLHRPWPLVMVASSLALALALVVGAHGPVRGALALWFFLTCPGMAIIGLLDIKDLLAEVLLAVALSIAIGMLSALAMALAHAWSADAATAALVVLTLLGARAQVVRR